MVVAPKTVGIDLGGTKIAAIGYCSDNGFGEIIEVPTPRNDYWGTIKSIADLIGKIETELGTEAHIGIGMPGSLTAQGGLVQNANSTWLNGKPLRSDLFAAIDRPLCFANDANCFALSEAIDGAGEGARSLFGIIIGTGCGGGLVIDSKIIEGANRIGGEWGHNPLPWPSVSDCTDSTNCTDDLDASEVPGPLCWCGRRGCMEAWVSGPALGADHLRHTGQDLTSIDISKLALSGDKAARASLERHADRLARGIAMVINIFDPERIVLGGGLSNLDHLYQDLPELIGPHIFADEKKVDIRPPKHGAMSGVRGAARLWEGEEY